VEQEPAGRGGGVDGLGQAAQRDAAPLQPLRDLGQVPQGAPEPVQTPADHGVPGAGGVEQLGQFAPVGASAARGLDEGALAAGGAQRVHLEVVVRRARAGIEATARG
jgi:hypothetical protein